MDSLHAALDGGRVVATGKGGKVGDGTIDVGAVKLRVDRLEEFPQIFDEAWRMEQEYFYADNMHGLDWDAVYRKYRPLVDHAGRREDLNAVIVEMIAGETSTWRDIKVYGNHAYVGSEHEDHGVQVFDLTNVRGAEPGTSRPHPSHPHRSRQRAGPDVDRGPGANVRRIGS